MFGFVPKIIVKKKCNRQISPERSFHIYFFKKTSFYRITRFGGKYFFWDSFLVTIWGGMAKILKIPRNFSVFINKYIN